MKVIESWEGIERHYLGETDISKYLILCLLVHFFFLGGRGVFV